MKNSIQVKICIVLIVSLSLTMASCQPVHNASYSHSSQRTWLKTIHWDEEDRIGSLNGADILIAVIGPRIDAMHPDLIGKVSEEIYLGKDMEIPKTYEKGTCIAGVICARPYLTDGALGIASEAGLMSIVLGASSPFFGPDEPVDAALMASGIRQATEREPDIILITQNVPEDSDDLKRAVDAAYQAGIVVIAPVTEDGIYPVKYPNVLAVDMLEKLQNGSVVGSEEVIYLPGSAYTTTSSYYSPVRYASEGGTELSAAVLAGTVAVILGDVPQTTQEDIYECFKGWYDKELNLSELLQELKHKYGG